MQTRITESSQAGPGGRMINASEAVDVHQMRGYKPPLLYTRVHRSTMRVARAAKDPPTDDRNIRVLEIDVGPPIVIEI